MRKSITKVKKSAPGTSLARPGDPLVTGRGEVIEPENKPKKKVKEEIAQEIIDPADYRPQTRRMIKELPAEAKVITAVGAVFMYTLMGVGDREIADTLGTTVEEITGLRKHSAYGECFQIIHNEFINASSALLTSRIAAYSHSALRTMGGLVTDAKKEEVRFRASADILDRAGVRPKDQEQKQAANRNDLRIIVVDGEKSSNLEVNPMGEM